MIFYSIIDVYHNGLLVNSYISTPGQPVMLDLSNSIPILWNSRLTFRISPNGDRRWVSEINSGYINGNPFNLDMEEPLAVSPKDVLVVCCAENTWTILIRE